MQPTIVVTGGSRGIGKAIIQQFAKAGFNIITCARNEEELKNLKKEIEKSFHSSELSYLVIDVSKKQDIDRFIGFIQKKSNSIDILINNAGVFIPGEISTEKEGTLEKMIETNLYSAYHLTRGIVPIMQEKNSGHIFTICSTASITAYTNGGSYCISKFALYGMTKVLREEMKKYGIRVTAVMPGATLTSSWEGVDLPEDRFMKSEDVASIIYNTYLLSKQTVIEEIIVRPQLGDI